VVQIAGDHIAHARYGMESAQQVHPLDADSDVPHADLVVLARCLESGARCSGGQLIKDEISSVMRAHVHLPSHSISGITLSTAQAAASRLSMPGASRAAKRGHSAHLTSRLRLAAMYYTPLSS